LNAADACSMCAATRWHVERSHVASWRCVRPLVCASDVAVVFRAAPLSAMSEGKKFEWVRRCTSILKVTNSRARVR
jgi:hypothetical protein